MFAAMFDDVFYPPEGSFEGRVRSAFEYRRRLLYIRPIGLVMLYQFFYFLDQLTGCEFVEIQETAVALVTHTSGVVWLIKPFWKAEHRNSVKDRFELGVGSAVGDHELRVPVPEEIVLWNPLHHDQVSRK